MAASFLDFFVLLLILSVSAGIGVYHAVRASGENSVENYFLGNRKMNPVPIIFSIIVSSLSAVTYLGTPIETYIYGPLFWIVIFNKFIAAWIISQCFLPVFYRLRLTSIYEYLQLRFNTAVRCSVLVVDVANTVVYMGIIVYSPALALQTVTGFNLTISILVTGSVCTFYTAIGGLKAVVWTDVFQAVMMLIGFYAIIIYGCIEIGGPKEIFERLQDGGRGALVDFSLDPTIRYSFWSLMVGGLFFILAMLIKQPIIQRFNSCATERQAQMACTFGILGIGVIELTAVMSGIILFSYFSDCDPVSDGKIQRHDQLVPYFILTLFGDMPGFVGLLLGGAFCASLSSVSSLVNALAAITGEDVIKRLWKDIDEDRYTRLVKIVSALYGILATTVAFLATRLGGILYAALSFMGIFGAPVLGVFSLGIFVPKANSKGVLVGLVAGVAVGVFLKIGADIYPPVYHEVPAVMTSGCVNATTVLPYTSSTVRSPTAYSVSGLSCIFSISYLYYSFVTFWITFLVGSLVGVITNTKSDRLKVDPKLLSPIVLKYMPLSYQRTEGSEDVLSEKDKKRNSFNGLEEI